MICTIFSYSRLNVSFEHRSFQFRHSPNSLFLHLLCFGCHNQKMLVTSSVMMFYPMVSCKSLIVSYTLFFKGKESEAKGGLEINTCHVYKLRGKCWNWDRAWNIEERGWWVDQGLRHHEGVFCWAGGIQRPEERKDVRCPVRWLLFSLWSGPHVN